MVVIALAMMGLLVVATLTSSDDDRESSVAFQEGTRSFFAADAGLNQMLAQWGDSSYDTRIAAAGVADTFAWRTLPENGAVYRAIIQRLSTGGAMSLTVDGRSATARRGLRTVAVTLTTASTFRYAALGGSDVSFSSSNTDSWDSALGAYGGANVGTKGDIRSNGTISMLSGSTSIQGNAQAASTITSGGCTHVHGTICAAGQPTVPMPDVSCPAGFSPASDIPSGAGISYNAATGVLSVGGGKTLTLDYSHTPYRFSSMTFSGSSILTFTGTVQHVDINVSGAVNLSGGSISNPTGKPTNVSLWGCGNNTAGWTLTGGSNAFYAVYAPHHAVTLTGSSPLYGALVGGSISYTGGSTIHYDEALGRGAVALVAGSWTEVAH
jgi:hypothetical protein